MNILKGRGKCVLYANNAENFAQDEHILISFSKMV